MSICKFTQQNIHHKQSKSKSKSVGNICVMFAKQGTASSVDGTNNSLQRDCALKALVQGAYYESSILNLKNLSTQFNESNI